MRSKTAAARLVALSLVLLCLVIAEAAPAQAQTYGRGLFVNGHVGPARLVLDEDDARWGFGLGGRVGYGFSERIALYFDFYGAGLEDVAEGRFPADNDNAGFGSVALGVQVFLNEIGPGGAVAPYLTAAYGAHALAFDDGGDDDTFLSVGPTFGAGVRYYTAPRIALFADVRYAVSVFDENAGGDEIEEVDAQALRVVAGVVAYPFR